jgi:DNA topoisomerase-1
MIIYKFKEKGKDIFRDKSGKQITAPEVLDYVKKLVIPPAYTGVEIFYEKGKTPKMLYFGYDSKGRKQQIYSKKWREKADRDKFKSLIEFGKMLPVMMLKMSENIKSGSEKDKYISLILRVTSLCGFRIGQLKYHKLYNSVGLSTLQKKHVKATSSGMNIKFIGKKGMLNECDIDDKIIIDELKKLCVGKQSEDFLFKYSEGGESKLITAIDVNDWLKSYNKNFTTKYFRTFEVNDRLVEMLGKYNPEKMTLTERKKKVVELLKEVSCVINNTPAICKKSYVNPELIKTFIDHPKKYNSLMKGSDTPRLKFIKFLEQTY